MTPSSGKAGDTISITVKIPAGKEYREFMVLWDKEEIAHSSSTTFAVQVPQQESEDVVTIYVVGTGYRASLALNQFMYEKSQYSEGRL